jgi:hypothetical protein
MARTAWCKAFSLRGYRRPDRRHRQQHAALCHQIIQGGNASSRRSQPGLLLGGFFFLDRDQTLR